MALVWSISLCAAQTITLQCQNASFVPTKSDPGAFTPLSLTRRGKIITLFYNRSQKTIFALRSVIRKTNLVTLALL